MWQRLNSLEINPHSPPPPLLPFPSRSIEPYIYLQKEFFGRVTGVRDENTTTELIPQAGTIGTGSEFEFLIEKLLRRKSCLNQYISNIYSICWQISVFNFLKVSPTTLKMKRHRWRILYSMKTLNDLHFFEGAILLNLFQLLFILFSMGNLQTIQFHKMIIFFMFIIYLLNIHATWGAPLPFPLHTFDLYPINRSGKSRVKNYLCTLHQPASSDLLCP